MNFQAYALTNHPEWSSINLTAPTSEGRTPIHLCCILDTSGSMDMDNKLENVKNSLRFLLDFLGPQDAISIVTFSDLATTILSQVIATSIEKENIRTRVNLIQSDSNTNLSAGLIEARSTLFTDTQNCKQGILLLTDGIANVGLTQPDDILQIIQNMILQYGGTSISCVGYGIDHNVDLLQQISTSGGGSYYVVNSLEDVATVFGDVLGGLISCYAQQVRIIVPTGTEVKTRYATATTNNGLEITIGDMSAGMEAVVLAKLPIHSPVSYRGYSLIEHLTLEKYEIVRENLDPSLQTNGEAHYLRFEVLNMIEESKTLLHSRPTNEVVNQQITKINQCITQITTYRAGHEHSLWDILIEELNNCKRSLEHRHRYAHQDHHILTQHVSYLGRMRGIAAQSQYIDLTSEDEAHTPLTPPDLYRAFSNGAQRNISHHLTSAVTPGGTQYPRIHAPLNLSDISIISQDPRNIDTPSELSPIRETLSNITSQVDIQNNAGNFLAAPSPRSLRRQFAVGYNSSEVVEE
jgi:Mg-chelatase subunit ChlD